MIIPAQTEACPVIEVPSVEQLLSRVSYSGIPRMSVGDVTKVEITYRTPVEQMGEWVGERIAGDELDATTDHAWLVVMGQFAQALGLVKELEAVPIDQKQGPKCPPQTKLIELLVGILGGIEYLQDLNREAHPIATDPTIAQAWAQTIFAHYSGVSRTLDAADESTLVAVIETLRQVSRPFIQEAVMETIRKRGCLTADVDLTGREVSPTSTDYKDATFGWMDDDVRKGYQAAILSLVCERWQRLLLALQRYTGRTHSAECLQAMVRELEQVLGMRPRRRVALVQTQRQALQVRIRQVQDHWERNQRKEQAFRTIIIQSRSEAKTLQAEVVRLENEYQARGWKEKPHSQLAKTRHKLAAAQKREQRTWQGVKKVQTIRANQENEMRTLQEQQTHLDEWLAELEADNLANPNPIPFVLRIDAGFSTGENLAWLIEMGYIVLTKAHHSNISQSLRQRLVKPVTWTRVGRNAEAVNMGDYYQNDCPYPLQAMLIRYHLPDELRHTTLFYYADTPAPALPQWFRRYNARQTIEAGIKEEKAVFTLKRHLVRSPIGMQLQEQFALFAANFVRWAAAWAKDALRQANRRFETALDQVKTLIRIVSHTPARWVRKSVGNTLIFDPDGPFAHTILCLSGQVAVQLTLPLFNFKTL
ncbi:MAG: hypothetical protein QMD04_14265 [Anaerolineales bacterium]|nr:hypothetical protein [Anaerolineales bacterium]